MKDEAIYACEDLQSRTGRSSAGPSWHQTDTTTSMGFFKSLVHGLITPIPMHPATREARTSARSRRSTSITTWSSFEKGATTTDHLAGSATHGGEEYPSPHVDDPPKPDRPHPKVSDPEQRLSEDSRTGASLRLLNRGVIDRTVYADNSGYDLGALVGRFPSGSIEWVSFYDLDYDSSDHRGYGEFRLIDHAFRASGTLSAMNREDSVWKLTGRDVVKNLRTVMALAPSAFDLYCDVRGVWAGDGIHGVEPRRV